MIDEHRIQIMAMEYQMNPEKARKLLHRARDEPVAILMTNRRQMLAGGDTNGQKRREQEEKRVSFRIPETWQENKAYRS